MRDKWVSATPPSIAVSACSSRTGLVRAVASVAAGYGHTVALRIDGTVWTWGFNASGVLGTGSAEQQVHNPAQVAGIGPRRPTLWLVERSALLGVQSTE